MPEVVNPEHLDGTITSDMPDVAGVDAMAYTFDDEAINNVIFCDDLLQIMQKSIK